jgi:hypothetical protein
MTTRDDAHHDLHHHGIAEQFYAMHDSVSFAQHRVDALEIWKRWAAGDPVVAQDLRYTIDELVDHRSWKPTREHQLGQAIETWATHAGISGPNHPVRQPTRAHVGIELEL